MTSAFDLHCHSSASDGALSPARVVRRAAENGVRHLALTDHDSVAGIASARRAAEVLGVRLIAGVEISVTWEKRCFHILGLGVDPANETLCRGLAGLQRIRRERAAAMAENLARHGIEGSLAAVEEMAGEGMITRTHFARFLVARDYAASVAEVFDRYLVRGKPGYVATRWAGLEEALEWIRAAGGVAVLAHPLRYQLTASWLRRFLSAFQSAGGVGIEVVNGNSTPNQIATCADYARRYRLAGSVGSDFHDPAFPWIDLGRLEPLPPGVEPVWNAFNL
ncbi:3',5'-nucleoside bisphosphate phosphatase [Methylomarinovum caldicuralii]|uniref:3',5'-nucleoside bisphosphate phosphatase n=1 Tax=Methylomarinovum caldicuralii TaxID=438856 RepID=A0AAU9C0M2_9GAMM|nr:PHP domain-containing protein [Methylomarinovum caldicuralii]BCX81103.1 3',5'-nucleoside bisphosphate phosphatase [Methylomarinovum caldicuralii]